MVGTYADKKGKIKPIKQLLRFIDSFKFMASSLDKLVSNLDRESFTNTKKFFKGQQLNLLLRKGVYPYDYMDSVKRLSETQLPPKEAFYSRLSGGGISDEDYEHAQQVWKEVGMKTLRNYHDLYNKSDVLLLADVFENFRDVWFTNYELDPAWYYTAQGLAWDAALKITEVNLELLSDPDMLLMVEQGIRGGISMICNRHGKANNPYMGDKYNKEETTKYITYLDARTTFMVGQGANPSQHMVLSGWMKASWRTGRTRNAFSRPTWSIPFGFTTYITIIPSLQKALMLETWKS